MTEAPAPYLEGSGRSRLSFEDIDQEYRLKLHAFVGLCMGPTFEDLESRLPILSLRSEGTIPIMFFLRFESDPQPVVFGSRIETRHRVALRRGAPPAKPGDDATPQARLLLEMDVAIFGEEGVADPRLLGAAPPTARGMVPVGRMRGLHVFTRPVGPPEERLVTEVPPQLQALQAQPLDEPYPTVEGVQAVPPDYLEQASGPWQQQRSVWGLHNTDVNQHVNVVQYLTSLEDHCSRMLHGAKLPVARHRISALSILFRKPFFKGDAHALQGRLYTRGARTLLLGGVYRVDPEGNVDPRPSVFARLEGQFAAEG